MSIEIEGSVLKRACMEMIETILFCLPNAFKGTIYRIGKPPELIAERITSGIIDEDRDSISWGLPMKSEYNPPGKPWIHYRDTPGLPHEAMSWCVEKQKSWTAEDPNSDARSVRLQVSQGHEDCHHMEPVLVRKSDLNMDMYSHLEYPRDYAGNVIWKASDYVVVAVVKIHFKPNSIKIGGQETKVIKRLSHFFGTELLSYQLSANSLRAMQKLARDRLNACNILADSLRNSITKSSLIFSLLKQEVGYLREQWEQMLVEQRKEENPKVQGIRSLAEILTGLDGGNSEIREALSKAQMKFLETSLPPEQGERWLSMQIEERWKELLKTYPLDDGGKERVWKAIDQLKRSLRFGQDPDVLAHYDRIPEEVKSEWARLLYSSTDSFDPAVINRLIGLLENPVIGIPSRKKSRKVLIQLKALAETMSNLERNTNFLLHQVLNGNSGAEGPGFPQDLDAAAEIKGGRSLRLSSGG